MIPKPGLDDRTFDDLVAEARTLIPRYAPQWTDHNWSDPGITFIDLFAWLAEIAIYRMDQITDSHRLKFLRLLGSPVCPALPARVALTFEKPKSPQVFRRGTVVSADIAGDNIRFELDDEITTAPTELKKIIVDEGGAGVFDRTDANEKGDQFFAPFGLSVQEGCSLHLGFDQPVQALSLFCYLYETDLIPTGKHGDEKDRSFTNAMLAWEYLAPGNNWVDIPAGTTGTHYTDRTEGLKKSGRIRFSGLPDIWQPAENSRDTNDNGSGPLCWLRCLVKDSSFEYPPRLEMIRANTITATHGRVIRDYGKKQVGTGLPDQVKILDYSPVLYRSLQLAVINRDDEGIPWSRLMDDADSRDRLRTRLYERFSIGWILDRECGIEKNQSATTITIFSKDRSRSLILTQEFSEVTCTLDDGRSAVFFRFTGSNEFYLDSWTEVDDFDGSGPDDCHFVVDYQENRIRFGNGQYGRVPEPGMDIRIIRYRTGGGQNGNIGAGLRWKIDEIAGGLPGDADAEYIYNPRPAHGGTDQESIDDAFQHVRRDLKIPYTAVTADDYEYIARHTPGLRVAKANASAIPPDSSGKPTGAVRIVIVPFTPLKTFDYPPVPSKGFLIEVCRHLERHRLLGTEICVTGADYVRVSVDVTIVPADGWIESTVRSAVTDKLSGFLHPITGGRDHTGWPIGCMVARSEVYDLLDETGGVSCVLQLKISGDNKSYTDEDGNLQMPSVSATVYSGKMTVTVIRDPPRCRKSGRG